MASTEGILSSQELLKAQAHLWNDMFAFMRSFSLKCDIELGIPDAVFNHGKPITIDELATAISVPACRVENLRRFMSLLVYGGYFERTLVPVTNQEVYSLTPNSMILVREQGASIAPMIELELCETLIVPWQSLSAWFKREQPSTCFEMCHGVYCWDAMATKPEFGRLMQGGFDADAAVVTKALIEKCADQFQGIKSLVDVVPKSAKIAHAVARAFPHIKCTVFDLPHMIDAIQDMARAFPQIKCPVFDLPHMIDAIQDKGDLVGDLVQYVAGDMFERIPPADALILRWVLMMWGDEECVKILKRCREAIPTKEKGGKVIIIEKVLDVGDDSIHPRLTETQLFFDLLMMVHLTGRQRTEKEWNKLFTEAGFKEYKIIPILGMRCIIELYH